MKFAHQFFTTAILLFAFFSMHGQATVTADSSKTSANKELVRKIFDDLINKKNLAKIDQYFASDAIDHSAFPDQAPGREGLKAVVKSMFEAYPDIHVEIQEIIAERDLVVTRDFWTATDKSTGQKKSGWVIHMIKLKNGVVTEEWSKGWEWLN